MKTDSHQVVIMVLPAVAEVNTLADCTPIAVSSFRVESRSPDEWAYRFSLAAQTLLAGLPAAELRAAVEETRKQDGAFLRACVSTDERSEEASSSSNDPRATTEGSAS